MYLLYSSFLLVFALVSFKANKYSSYFFILIYFGFSVLVFGLRYGVGIDYFSYEYYFYNRAESFSSEPAYSLVNWLFYMAGFDFYSVTIFVFSTIFILVVSGLIKFGVSGKYLMLAILIFSGNTMLLYLNGMRQGVAAAFCFLGTTFLFGRHYIKYLAIIILGAMFHYSAALFLVLPLAFKLVASWPVLVAFIFLVPLAFISSFFLNYSAIFQYVILATGFYNQYEFSSHGDVSGFPLGVFLRVFSCFFLLLWVFVGRAWVSKEVLFSVNMYSLGVIFNAISIQNFLFGRIGYLFYLFEVLAISLIILNTKRKNEKSFLFLAFTLYGILFIVVSLLLGASSYGLEYRSIISKP